jgi:hypothetical protein
MLHSASESITFALYKNAHHEKNVFRPRDCLSVSNRVIRTAENTGGKSYTNYQTGFRSFFYRTFLFPPCYEG